MSFEADPVRDPISFHRTKEDKMLSFSLSFAVSLYIRVAGPFHSMTINTVGDTPHFERLLRHHLDCTSGIRHIPNPEAHSPRHTTPNWLPPIDVSSPSEGSRSMAPWFPFFSHHPNSQTSSNPRNRPGYELVRHHEELGAGAGMSGGNGRVWCGKGGGTGMIGVGPGGYRHVMDYEREVTVSDAHHIAELDLLR